MEKVKDYKLISKKKKTLDINIWESELVKNGVIYD